MPCNIHSQQALAYRVCSPPRGEAQDDALLARQLLPLLVELLQMLPRPFVLTAQLRDARDIRPRARLGQRRFDLRQARLQRRYLGFQSLKCAYWEAARPL